MATLDDGNWLVVDGDEPLDAEEMKVELDERWPPRAGEQGPRPDDTAIGEYIGILRFDAAGAATAIASARQMVADGDTISTTRMPSTRLQPTSRCGRVDARRRGPRSTTTPTTGGRSGSRPSSIGRDSHERPVAPHRSVRIPRLMRVVRGADDAVLDAMGELIERARPVLIVHSGDRSATGYGGRIEAAARAVRLTPSRLPHRDATARRRSRRWSR